MSIPAGGTRTVFIFEVKSDGSLSFARDVAARDYVEFFAGGTVFRGSLEVIDRYYSGPTIDFTVQIEPLQFQVNRIVPPDPKDVQDVRKDRPQVFGN